jgi:hypothetical protein
MAEDGAARSRAGSPRPRCRPYRSGVAGASTILG